MYTTKNAPKTEAFWQRIIYLNVQDGAADSRAGRKILPVLLQKFAQKVHHRPLMLHKTVRVAVERDDGIFVAEDFRQGFYVHSAFEGARGEGMAQRMKPPMRDLQFF